METDEHFVSFKTNVDQLFLLINSFFGIFMQCGFAFLEAGAVRSKNCTHMLCKNILDTFTCAIAFWIFGYAFAYGYPSNGFIGYGNFALHNLNETHFAFYIFQTSFATTAATIVSGALAERCHIVAYIIYSVVLSGVIYPVVAHWAWSPTGWLKKGEWYLARSDSVHLHIGFSDFAGSGVIHVVGGTCALMGAYFLGPRIARFGEDSQGKTIIASKYRGHSLPLSALGGFIMFIGFFAQMVGSQGHLSKPGDGRTIGLVVVNAIICASSSALTLLCWNRISGVRKWSILPSLNGAFCGMAAVAAGCNTFYPWCSIPIGIVSALVYKLWVRLLIRWRIDDPINAVAVHLGGGLWGIIAVALFDRKTGVLFAFDRRSGLILGWQFCSLFVIVLWTTLLSGLLFFILNTINVLRVDQVTEEKGLDIGIHGEDAYPIESYGHGWMSDISDWLHKTFGDGKLDEPMNAMHIHTE